MSEFRVAVGLATQFSPFERQQRKGLAEAVKNEGFDVLVLDPEEIPKDKYSIRICNAYRWPRDEWVLLPDNTYVTRRISKLSYECNSYGEGGFLLFDNLQSDKVFVGADIASSHGRLIHYSGNVDYLYRFIRGNLFFPEKISMHIIYSGYSNKVLPSRNIDNLPEHIRWLGHLDLSCFYVTSINTLFVDTSKYDSIPDDAEKLRAYNIFKNLEKIVRVEYFSEKESQYDFFPSNCLVLPKGNGEIVFSNVQSKNLNTLLRKSGIDVIEIDFEEVVKKRGSIRCCTNILRKETKLEDLLLL